MNASSKTPATLNLQPAVVGRPATEANLLLVMGQPFAPQIKQAISKVGLRVLRKPDLLLDNSGQGHAAPMVSAFLTGVNDGLPTTVVRNPRGNAPTEKELDLEAIRQAARTRRGINQEGQPATGELVIINFAHPIVPADLAKIATDRGVSVEDIEIRTVKVQIDVEIDLPTQFSTLVDRAKLVDWETENVVINPPAFGLAADGLMAEIHGRRGHYPAIIRIGKPEGEDAFRFIETIEMDSVVSAGRAWAAQEAGEPAYMRLSSTVPADAAEQLATLARELGIEVRA